MNDEILALLQTLADKLGVHAHDCQCNRCCDCTTERTFEASAARFNESAAFSAAESQKAFVQQNAAQFAQLLKQTSS